MEKRIIDFTQSFVEACKEQFNQEISPIAWNIMASKVEQSLRQYTLYQQH